MGNINVARVVLGGIVAGIVITLGEFVNDALTGEALREHMASLGLTGDIGTGQIVLLSATALVYGIVMIWFYAAARPRFGAGVKTALIVGFALWLLSGLVATVQLSVLGFLPSGSPTVIATAWSLVEFLAAIVAGAWLYKES